MTNPAEIRSESVALNADVVGYSALMADDIGSTTATMTDHRQLVADSVAASGGTLVNFVGDNFMAVFDDAVSALRTAIHISTEVEARNAELAPSRHVRYRMGMDLGHVTIVGGNHHGDVLNIAARIQAIARPGGLAVSGRVYRALDEPALRFRPTGRHQLKNIPEPVDVYEFADLPTDRSGEAGGTTLALEAPTIAILPIHTGTVDDAAVAAAQIIRSDLVHRLAATPGLVVIDAPTAVEPGQASTAAQYMLETGVHQLGGKIRVYATIFHVKTMNIVKSHRWTIDADEMFALADRVADDVAHSVDVELVVGEPARLYAELDDPVAIEKIYLGWFHLRDDTRDGWQRALELFEQVAQAHPDHPYGHVLSGFALWLGASNGWASDLPQMLIRADESAARGTAVGDPTGMAQAVHAAVLMSQGRVDEALSALDHLEMVRPTCDITYGLEANLRRYLGQWERAVELLDVAMRLTGINKPWYPTIKASSLFVGGRLDEAASIAEGVLEYQPNNLEALLVLAAAQVEMGLDRRSRATADLVKERFPSVDVEDWLDKTPYQRREIVDRWKGDLISAGAIETA